MRSNAPWLNLLGNEMTTIGTLFSGGEGVGVGARQAGIDHLWGVEFDDAIAQVGRTNGFNTITGNVMDTALMLSLPRPDVIHASPVCKNASNAKANGEESPLDIATADATCAYINHFLPDIFTLENVWGYRTFTAFAHILECLNRNGYHVDYWHLNAADYGVPQTRRRLILVARFLCKPRKPIATHADPQKLTPMFDTRLPWVGWYKAIDDLIDTLPSSKFAPWQLERLPSELSECAMFSNDQSDDHKFTEKGYGVTTRRTDTPSITLKTGYIPLAFIVNGTPNDYGASVTACASDEPCYTMTGSMDKRPARAFIVNTREDHHGEGITIADEDEPIYTILSTSSNDRHKAFIMPNANTSSGVMRYDDEPAPTQGNTDRVGNQPRAFLLGDQQQQIADVVEPSNTVRAYSGGGASPRAWLSAGRVVKMTPRALARFQSFPDNYILPDKSKLACTVIGNAVPPLLYQCVIEAQR